METIVIGIAGGSGSGKTTLANKLKEALGDDIVLLCHDFYYKAHDDMPFEERKKLNFDHPDAFDTDLLIEDLRALKRGESILHPVYSFTEHTRLPERVRVDPARVVLVEGILIFENKELRDEMDIKVYVDTDADIRLIRRLLRDVKERGAHPGFGRHPVYEYGEANARAVCRAQQKACGYHYTGRRYEHRRSSDAAAADPALPEGDSRRLTGVCEECKRSCGKM